jgi:hypothetical protein
MHNELRYQEKTHAKSGKLSKERNKVPHLLPNIYIFFLRTINRKTTKTFLWKRK